MKAKDGFGRRLLIDVGVGMGIIALAGLVFAISLVIGRVPPFNWIMFVGLTPILFWVVLKRYKRYWRRPTLWLATAGLLAVHVAIFSMVLRTYPQWPGVWFLPVGAVEVWPIELVLCKIVHGR
jgi:hypothetical protein